MSAIMPWYWDKRRPTPRRARIRYLFVTSHEVRQLKNVNVPKARYSASLPPNKKKFGVHYTGNNQLNNFSFFRAIGLKVIGYTGDGDKVK
jgi:hypothetical protein